MIQNWVVQGYYFITSDREIWPILTISFVFACIALSKLLAISQPTPFVQCFNGTCQVSYNQHPQYQVNPLGQSSIEQQDEQDNHQLNDQDKRQDKEEHEDDLKDKEQNLQQNEYGHQDKHEDKQQHQDGQHNNHDKQDKQQDDHEDQ